MSSLNPHLKTEDMAAIAVNTPVEHKKCKHHDNCSVNNPSGLIGISSSGNSITLDQQPTGAVRSNDLARKRYDLIPFSFVRDYFQHCFRDRHSTYNSGYSDIALIQNCITHIYNFLCNPFSNKERQESLLDTSSLLTVFIRQRDRLSSWEAAQHEFLEGIARAFHEGSLPHKYGANNWLLGFPIEDVLNHAIEHLLKYNSGDRSEDHIGHCSWNICVAYHYYMNRPELCTGLLGPNYGLTDEIKKNLKEHASRKRLIQQNKESI